jgi:hypothetical protein
MAFMIRTFDQPGDFAAQAAAKQWLHERGYSVGIMEADAPRGIMRGDVLIAKWCNLSPRERATLDGQMTGDMRNGPVTVEIFGERMGYRA